MKLASHKDGHQVHGTNIHTGQHVATKLIKKDSSVSSSPFGHPPEKQPTKQLKMGSSRHDWKPLS